MQLPKMDTPVQIKNEIAPEAECAGFLVKPSYLSARKAGAEGYYVGWVPGCGGDVWWVRHKDGSVGAYMYTEVEVLAMSSAQRLVVGADDGYEDVDIDRMHLEDVKQVLSALFKHLGVKLQYRDGRYQGDEYRIAPEGP